MVAAVTTEPPERELDDLWDDGEFVLSRVRCHPRRPAELVVRPAAAHPADETIARLEHSHSLRGDLDQSWAARPAELIGPRQRLALRLEDPGGEVLATLLGKPWDVRSFLRAAVGVASALSGLHGRGLVHKDVKPSNVLVDVATGSAWLTGFGIASRLRRERQAPEPPEIQPEAELARHRDAILPAIEPYGQFIINLVPQLERVIGEQPSIVDLSPQDAQRVFEQVLRRVDDSPRDGWNAAITQSSST